MAQGKAGRSVILSDKDIYHAYLSNKLDIYPFDECAIQPASYDLRLSDPVRMLLWKTPGEKPAIYWRSVRENAEHWMVEQESVLLEPGQFALVHTKERVYIGPTLVGRVEGKSSLGRLGLFVHITAGYIDPGFDGNITLELFNASPYGLELVPGMPIAQISFHELKNPAQKLYSGKYQHAEGPQASRYHLNFEVSRELAEESRRQAERAALRLARLLKREPK